ncbi:MAG: putative lipoprotein [Spirochaetota bacterium]
MKSNLTFFTLGILLCFVQCGTASQSLNSISTASQSLNSISNASQSVSSISQSLASISGSLTPSAAKTQELFETDVASLTQLYVQQKSNVSFAEEIQELALSHGITMWEMNSGSYTGIGRGLRKAGMSESRINTFLEQSKLKNSRIEELIRLGYHS